MYQFIIKRAEIICFFNGNCRKIVILQKQKNDIDRYFETFFYLIYTLNHKSATFITLCSKGKRSW